MVELVTQKLGKKSIASISHIIAHFYHHRIEREKLNKIDLLIIKIGYKMADLWKFILLIYARGIQYGGLERHLIYYYYSFILSSQVFSENLTKIQ